MIFKSAIAQFDENIYNVVSTSITSYINNDIDEDCEIYHSWSSTDNNTFSKHSLFDGIFKTKFGDIHHYLNCTVIKYEKE